MNKVVTIAVGVATILVVKTAVKIVMHKNFTVTTFGGIVITELLANGAGFAAAHVVTKAIENAIASELTE